MKIYLVGGAVRDFILGRQIKDRDFVVVGATEQQMLDRGFKKVGADFPVFLHPVSGEEFALARRERKSGHGYNGFEVQFDPSVTLEDDLIRRDLTMNAMAVPVVEMDSNGVPVVDFDAIIDPYNGREDIADKTLRHVSTAFAEDPVRVLRVARFAARYNFVPAPETIELMTNLVTSGELDHLVAERVWAEMERALMESHPFAFFHTLWYSRADVRLFPELNFVDQRFQMHLERMSDLDMPSRFALLTLDLEEELVRSFFERLKAPLEVPRLALRTRKIHALLRRPLTAESVVATLESVGAFQDTTDTLAALNVCKTSLENLSSEFMVRRRDVTDMLKAVTSVRFADLTVDQQQTLKGPAVGAALREVRLNRASRALASL